MQNGKIPLSFRNVVRNLLAPWNKIRDFEAKRIPSGFKCLYTAIVRVVPELVEGRIAYALNENSTLMTLIELINADFYPSSLLACPDSYREGVVGYLFVTNVLAAQTVNTQRALRL